MEITNKTEYSTITSNLVYPLGLGIYRVTVKIDPQYVKDQLIRLFNCKRIGNKYVIDVNGKLWYQHDNDTWLIETK